MVLVDTSVWIRFLANRAPYARELDKLLAADDIAGHQLVFGELLAGDCGGRPPLLAAYERMHRANTIPHGDVVEFVRHRKLHGRGVGWVDLHLLASAVVSHVPLWTADSRLDNLALEMGVSYRF